MYGARTWRGVWSPDPLNEMRRLQWEMSRLLSGASQYQELEYPALNVLLSEDDVIVKAEAPGLDPDKTDISVIRDVLTISGSREPELLKEGENYHRQERMTGRFTRTLKLPFSVDSGKVEAKYDKGILTIKLPRAEEDRPHRIEVKSE